jgi:hypothetical protein
MISCPNKVFKSKNNQKIPDSFNLKKNIFKASILQKKLNSFNVVTKNTK